MPKNRTTRDKLKRVLDENIPRNLQANVDALSEMFLIYSQSQDEEAQSIAMGIAQILEAHEQVMAFAILLNKEV